MVDNKDNHHRKSIRLRGYDYSHGGVYFVTINIKDRMISPCFMGQITKGEVMLNDIEKIVSEVWQEIPAHFEGVELDAFIIMPDHIHGVIIINDLDSPSKDENIHSLKHRGVVKPEFALKKRSLGSIVGSFKAEV